MEVPISPVSGPSSPTPRIKTYEIFFCHVLILALMNLFTIKVASDSLVTDNKYFFKFYKIRKRGKIIESRYPGLYAGIVTMGIFGTLTCKSGMRALKKNRIFFHFWSDAMLTGMRPCKLCKPVKLCRAEKALKQKLKTDV